MKRYFEQEDKFWDIEQDGPKIVNTYGKVGKQGKRAETSFSSAADASRSCEKKVREKLAAGYREKTFPFPFFGTCFDHYFQEAEIVVRFVDAPSEKQLEAIIRDARAPGVIKPGCFDFRGKMLAAVIPKLAHLSIEGTYGTGGNAIPDPPDIEIDFDDEDSVGRLTVASTFEASEQALNAFEADVVRWLREIHTFCPVEFACSTEDGDDVVKRQTHWHIISQGLARAMVGRWAADPATYGQDEGERDMFGYALELMFLKSGIKGENVPDRLLDYVFPELGMLKLFYQGKWQAAVDMFLKNSHEKDMQHRFNRCLYDLDMDKPEERKILLGTIRAVLFATEPDNYGLPYMLGKVAHAAVLEGDQEMIGLIIKFCSDPVSPLACAYANNISAYAYNMLKEGNYPLLRELYRIAMDIATPPTGTDLSIYSNSLWVLQKDNTGLPVDKALNEEFLEKCLPHGAESPNVSIYFNAACLYVEMDDFERAFECAGLVMQFNPGQYDNMIAQFKTGAMFKEFRKDPRVIKMIEG